MAEKFDVECTPLRTLEQVLSWDSFDHGCSEKVLPLSKSTSYCVSGRQYCHESVLRPQSRCERSSVPRTLVCHDLKGGYLEDRFLNDCSKHEEYRFFHWAGVDLFVYFSHNFITIPPVGWINAGHLHGVKVLGTVITEWTDGEKMWSEILQSDKILQLFAKSLSDICHFYHFDGYLLNVENKIDPALMPNFIKFVNLLYQSLHEAVETAELIWYDSVTHNGELKWQNELNKCNRLFFDICDGIFLNYTWDEQNLDVSVKNAGVRGYDVFVGVDVFGRNCFGGGGYQTNQAFEVIKEYNLSVALFAQAWTYECFKDLDSFVYREYAFWQKLWPYLFIHGPSELPFSTSFCQGTGKKYFFNGKVVSEYPWYNMSKQQYQPSVTSCLAHGCTISAEQHAKLKQEITINDKGCMFHYSEDAFEGGGCLIIKHLPLRRSSPANLITTRNVTSERMKETSVADAVENKSPVARELSNYFYKRLLVCNFTSSGLILLSVAVKDPYNTGTRVNILVLVRESSGSYITKELIDSYTPSHNESGIYPHPQPEVLNKEIYDLFNKNLPQPHENSGWRMNHYLFHVSGNILEIGGRITQEGGEILLGYLAIHPYGRSYSSVKHQ